MTRPTVEVADLLRSQGDRFLEQNPWLSFQQLTVLRAISRCRTAALGGHIDTCSSCGQQAISYNSCRNRHCPKCQAQARQRWLEAREKELLGVKYFHVVFTLPHQLNALCRRNARILYDLLFSASAAAMLELATNPKWLGARIGFIGILHTWGQNLLCHPGRRSVPGSYPLGASPVSVLLTRQDPQPRVSGQVREPPQAGVSQKETAVPSRQPGPGTAPAVAAISPHVVPRGLGGLCQASFRRRSQGVALPRPVHSPCGHQQSSPAGFRPGARHLPLAGLRARQPTTTDDAHRQRVPAALPATCSAARIGAHSTVRPPGQ